MTFCWQLAVGLVSCQLSPSEVKQQRLQSELAGGRILKTVYTTGCFNTSAGTTVYSCSVRPRCRAPWTAGRPTECGDAVIVQTWGRGLQKHAGRLHTSGRSLLQQLIGQWTRLCDVSSCRAVTSSCHLIQRTRLLDEKIDTTLMSCLEPAATLHRSAGQIE